MPWRRFSDGKNILWAYIRDVTAGISWLFLKKKYRAYIKRLSASGMAELLYRWYHPSQYSYLSPHLSFS
jgi:hypothetical protein